MNTPLSRRHFLSLSGGVLVTGLTRPSQAWGAGLTVASPARSLHPRSVPAATTADRVLILVQLNGGNDGLNTVVPSAGAYHDARPTLGLTDSDVVDAGMSDYAFHPALSPLVARMRAGEMAAVHGIGFAEPNRSHFVAMDRWARADRMSEPLGWLGRWADPLAASLGPLDTVALSGGAPVLVGERHQPAVILTPEGFSLPPTVPADVLRSMATPADDDDLFAAVQGSYLAAIGTVDAFAAIVSGDSGDGGDAGDDPPSDAAGGITSSLGVAAKIVAGSSSTRLIVVNAGGFDTHANQLADHRELLADFAAGVDRLLTDLAATGNASRVLTVAISEFGRRVAENASGGTDHGAGGLAMAFGPMVHGGLYGGVDFATLLDGDVPPVVPTAALLTVCAGWIGADPATLLGAADASLATLVRTPSP